MKLTLEQHHMLSVLCRQYYVCWYTGHFKSQAIIRHGINLQFNPEYSISSIRRVKYHIHNGAEAA